MKAIFTQKVKNIMIISFVLLAVSVGIWYTWHMFANGQFGQY
jgi:hypothetical protein